MLIRQLQEQHYYQYMQQIYQQQMQTHAANAISSTMNANNGQQQVRNSSWL